MPFSFKSGLGAFKDELTKISDSPRSTKADDTMVDSNSNDDILQPLRTRAVDFVVPAPYDAHLSRLDFTDQQQIPTTMNHNRDGAHEGLGVSFHLRPIGNNEARESTKHNDLDGDEMMEQLQESSKERSTATITPMKEKKEASIDVQKVEIFNKAIEEERKTIKSK